MTQAGQHADTQGGNVSSRPTDTMLLYRLLAYSVQKLQPLAAIRGEALNHPLLHNMPAVRVYSVTADRYEWVACRDVTLLRLVRLLDGPEGLSEVAHQLLREDPPNAGDS